MPPGKMAAQAGHAFVAALHEAENHWDSDSEAHANFIAYSQEHPGTKIVLVAPDEATLRRIYEVSWKFIPSDLVFDSGHILPPHFDGNRILTAAGFGPCTKAQAAPFLGRLPLVP